MTPAIVGIPIKPFGVAKRRLASVLDAPTRSRVGKAIAAHTARAVAASGATPVVVTADRAVAAWAEGHHWSVIDEPPGGGLDGAGAAVAAAAVEQRWAVLHADLPMLGAADLLAAWDAPGTVLAPSHDGGTSLVVGAGSFPFSYGPTSFHRHAAAQPTARVICRPGLAFDLDTPADLRLALACAAGSWLRELLSTMKTDGPSSRT